MDLRPYQEDAVTSLFDWFGSQSITDHPLLSLPTASGKTVIFSTFIKRQIMSYPDTRFLVLAHRQELIEQAENKIKNVWPQAPVGVLSSSLKRHELNAQILVASRDTLAAGSRLEKVGKFDYIIIDEAHNLSPDDQTRYQKIITKLSTEHATRVMGVTATPYRMGQGYIYGKRKDHFFSDVAYQAKIPDLIDQGYLARIVSYQVADETIIDASKAKLKFKGGDYKESDLEKLALDEQTILAIIADWSDKAYSKGRTATVFFCVSVLHAMKMNMFLAKQGIKSKLLTGETPGDERRQILADFESGELNVICNVGVLTEGWDAPKTDCIAMLRPTQSLGLYVQMCGRGMRVYPGKENCLLLDYGENIARHGCIDTAQPNQEFKVRRPKICGECLAISPPHAKKCIECGAEFPISEFSTYLVPMEERKVAKQTKAASGAVISDEKPGVRTKEEIVTSTSATLATSKNGNDYCRVFFQIEDSFLPRSLPLMFEHPRMSGLAINQWCRIVDAKKWGVPRRSEDAVRKINQGAMQDVNKITVKKEGKYFNVKRVVVTNKEVYI
jgi:DNA repair protein RadD